jgi:hypothetical protein
MEIVVPGLYPHQEDLRDRTRAALAKHGRVILCANTGVGKTRLAKWILGAGLNREPKENQSGRSLFTVHRRGLVDNASKSFAESPELPHGIIMSGKETSYGRRVQVASIDTMLSWFVEGGAYPSDVTFDLIVWDECVSGDSIVETDKGAMRIDEIPSRRPSAVKSYSEDRGVHFSRILNWKHSGFRETIVIHTHAGKIRCTPDHEIFTRRGWLQAQFVSHSDEILACADARDALGKDRCSLGDARRRPASRLSTVPGKSFAIKHLYANADVARRFAQHSSRKTIGFRVECRPGTTASPTATRNARLTRALNSQHLNGRRYSARYSATRRLVTRIGIPSFRDYRVLTAISSSRGQNTRLDSSTDSMPRRESRSMAVTEKCLFAPSRRVIRASSRYSTSFVATDLSGCHENGLTESATLGLRGGLATTEVVAARASCSIPKVSPRKNAKSSPNGSAKPSGRPAYAAQSIGTLSTSPVGRKSQLDAESVRISRNACDTSWQRVTRIDRASAVDVYDIEVESTHCFFANGLLVHNCHSHHPKFAKFLKHHDERRAQLGQHPAYVIGLSATPRADGLADVYKEIVLGPPAQWLIDNGFLSPFRYFRATQGKLDLLKKGNGDFTKESEAAAMDGLAGDLVRDWKQYAEGRPTVGFFPRRTHAQDAMGQLKAAGARVAYIDGDTSDDDRNRIFKELNRHDLDYLCNVQVVERGTDIPRIGCVQLCVQSGL